MLQEVWQPYNSATEVFSTSTTLWVDQLGREFHSAELHSDHALEKINHIAGMGQTLLLLSKNNAQTYAIGAKDY